MKVLKNDFGVENVFRHIKFDTQFDTSQMFFGDKVSPPIVGFTVWQYFTKALGVKLCHKPVFYSWQVWVDFHRATTNDGWHVLQNPAEVLRQVILKNLAVTPAINSAFFWPLTSNVLISTLKQQTEIPFAFKDWDLIRPLIAFGLFDLFWFWCWVFHLGRELLVSTVQQPVLRLWSRLGVLPGRISLYMHGWWLGFQMDSWSDGWQSFGDKTVLPIHRKPRPMKLSG